MKEVAQTDESNAVAKNMSKIASQAAKRAGQVQQKQCNLPPLPICGRMDVHGKKVRYKKNTSSTATANAPKNQRTLGTQNSPRSAEKAAVVAGVAISTSAVYKIDVNNGDGDDDALLTPIFTKNNKDINDVDTPTPLSTTTMLRMLSPQRLTPLQEKRLLHCCKCNLTPQLPIAHSWL